MRRKTITIILTEEMLNQKYIIHFKEENKTISMSYREFMKQYPNDSNQWKELLDLMFDGKVSIKKGDQNGLV